MNKRKIKLFLRVKGVKEYIKAEKFLPLNYDELSVEEQEELCERLLDEHLLVNVHSWYEVNEKTVEVDGWESLDFSCVSIPDDYLKLDDNWIEIDFDESQYRTRWRLTVFNNEQYSHIWGGQYTPYQDAIPKIIAELERLGFIDPKLEEEGE